MIRQLCIVVLLFDCRLSTQAAEPPNMDVHAHRESVDLFWWNNVEAHSMGAFIHQDRRIRRPFFANLAPPFARTLFTRAHPPGKDDPADHAEMHPGLWLAFGELSGCDFWRNKDRVVVEKFAVEPTGGGTLDGFDARATLLQRYEAADGRVVARETFAWSVVSLPVDSWSSGYRIDWDSTLEPSDAPLVFGDQEEMGLGVRLATPLTVAQGGKILTSEGRRNEKECWGRPADWCYYYVERLPGTNPFARGVVLLPHPDNFKRSSFHVRDYGLMVANPFAEKSFGRGEAPSRTTVAVGEKLRLRFGVVFFDGPAKNLDPATELARYVEDSKE